MAWFGESFANIKGQISTFTKEVLAETPEDEDGNQINATESSELVATKKAFADLQAFCSNQKKEIEHLKLLSDGFPSKASTIQEVDNVSSKELYEKEIFNKNEEIARLKLHIEELHKSEGASEAKLNEKLEEIRKEYEAKEWVTVEPEPDIKNPPVPKCEVIASTVSVQTVETALELCDVETSTDGSRLNEEDQGTNSEEESYRKELEERCAAYQQDLYILRSELMTIQADSDQEEELRAKFNEAVISILCSDFAIDGHPTLSKLKYSRPESTRAGEEVIMAAIRQLTSSWRGIIDQKTTLERTVTKLSTSKNYQLQSPVTSTTQDSSLDCDTANLSLNELQQQQVHPNDDSDSCDSQDFFPPRLDSFGLETILEEEKNDEDSKHESDDVDLHRSKTSSVEVPSRPEVEMLCSETQTDVDNNGVNALRAEILATLEVAYIRKEQEWHQTLEVRQAKAFRLESELERLKNHLVEMEDIHTGEMLGCEDKEKELQNQVNDLQHQLSRIMMQSERSADVKEELIRLESERDFAKAQCSSFEDQVQKLGIQLQNLNFVLEQFQKEKATEIDGIRQQLQGEMNRLHTANQTLNEELRTEKELLEKARSGLDAARELNLQIEEKSRTVSTLKTQILEREAEVAKLKSHLDELSNNNVAKIDRYLVKNLVVGYFSTPADKRQEVLRIIATVLDFNREDRQKTGLESTSLWPFRSESSGGDSNQSLSQAFIKFLETESQPKAQMKITMDEIARKHSRTNSESSTASGSNQSSSSTSHPSEISMNLPVLNQVDRSNSILKDILNPKT